MASKSLGTLTLDLVAKIGGFTGPLDQAARESSTRMEAIRKSARIAGAAIGGMAIASVAGLAALAVSASQTANEISRLSRASNATTDEFQRYAAGAHALGIENEALADIFKDVNDKVGDFLQTGGGGLADFFDNVAPKVGVTADEFRRLSGPEALGLYVSSLEKAGASQQDMTFYLEAIASDATALLPLLKDNAAGFKLLGEQAAQAGAIMDEKTIRAADELRAVTILTDQAMAGMRTQIASGLLPVMSDLSGTLLTASVSTDIASEAGQTFGGILKGVAATAFGAYAAFQAVGQSIAALAFGFSSAGVNASDLLLGPLAAPTIAFKVAKNFDAFKGALDIGFDDIGQNVEGYAAVLDGIWDAGSMQGPETDFKKRVKLIADLLAQSKTGAGSGGIVLDPNAESAEKAADAIAGQIAALQLQAQVVSKTADEATLFKLAQDGATESQLGMAEAALKTVAGFESAKKAQEDYKNLVSDLRTEEEKRTDTLREQLAILDAMQGLQPSEVADVAGRIANGATEDAPEFGGIDASVGGPAGELQKIDDAQEALEEWYGTQLEMLEGFRQERADLGATWDEEELALKQEHEDALAGIERARQMVAMAAGEEFFGNAASAAKVFFGENSKLYKAAFAVEKAYAIGKALMNIPKSYSDAFAAVVGIPIVGPVLAPVAGVAAAAAQVAQAAAIGGINMGGQAHDGIMSVPASGTWNLEKGERVTTANTSAALDKTLADIQSGQRSGSAPVAGGEITVNQTINTQGRIDRRTSAQMASDAARKQKQVQARFG